MIFLPGNVVVSVEGKYTDFAGWWESAGMAGMGSDPLKLQLKLRLQLGLQQRRFDT